MNPANAPTALPQDSSGPAWSADEPLVDRACGLHDRAVAAREAGDFAAAERLGRRALALMERGAGAHHPDVANVLLNLAGLYEDLARYPEAEASYQRAAAILAALPEDLGEDVDRLRVQAASRFGHFLGTRARYEEAETLLLAALERAESAFGGDAPEVADVLNVLGILGKFTGRLDAAEPRYRRALAILESVRGPDHPDVASLYHNLGGLEHARGRYAAGEPHARRSV